MQNKKGVAASPKDAATQVQYSVYSEEYYKTIIRRKSKRCKELENSNRGLWRAVVTLAAAFVLASALAAHFFVAASNRPAEVPQEPSEVQQEAATMDEPQDVAPRYELTEDERQAVVKAVVCETGGEDAEAAMLVAQCILNAAEMDDIRPTEVLERYQYADYDVQLTTTAFEAVADVFDRGNTITDEPILFFYAPERVESEWHESQRYILTHGGHKYFALPEVR